MPHSGTSSNRSIDAAAAAKEAPRPRVRFVGAGPGSIDLLTVRAVQAIEDADVVVHDQLVHPSVLALAPATARLVPVARDSSAGGEAGDAGLETGRTLRDLAVVGLNVVRLKGGDPSVFARLAEEMQPLREAGIDVEIVPGVTAAVAAAAAACIPLTSRSHASAVALVTGHQAGENGGLDIERLAGLPGTLVFYMGVERLEEWSLRLVAAGRRGDTPVAIVSQCGWQGERILLTTLADAAAAASRDAMVSPAVAIVGEVVGESSRPGDDAATRPRAGASAERPLTGRRIVVARPEGQADELAARLTALGAECLRVPAIRIEPPASWEPLDAAIRDVSSFDWIVFSSANGVAAFVERLRAMHRDGRHLGTARLAAVGAKTAVAISAAGFACDLAPSTVYSAESLADLLVDGPPSGRFLLVKADRGRDVLARRLAAAGRHVREVVAYRSVDVASIDPAVVDSLARRPADWITLTSPAIASAAIRLLGNHLAEARIASLSPLTSEAIRASGREPAVEAASATAEALAAAIVDWEKAPPVSPAVSPGSSQLSSRRP
jgi:uroporphyrinogen III methyltransferase/synthase